MLDVTPFLKDGKLAGITVGMMFEALEGNSDFGFFAENEKHYYYEDSRDSFSIFHDEIEYMFVSKVLNCISISVSGNYLNVLDKFHISVHTTVEKFLIYLDISSIKWEFQSKYTFGKQLFIKLESGVEISYLYTHENGFMLSKLQKYDKND